MEVQLVKMLLWALVSVQHLAHRDGEICNLETFLVGWGSELIGTNKT